MSYPKQWEYKEVWWDELIKPPFHGTIGYCDAAGLEGWELVARDGNSQYGFSYIFKRPLKPSTKR